MTQCWRRAMFASVIGTMAAATTTALSAQVTQRLSIEAAGLYQRLNGSLEPQTDPGTGYEAQVRYTSGGWSIGLGVDYLQHERRLVTLTGSPPTVVIKSGDADFVGAFVEPRLPLGRPGGTVVPYLMLRAGYARATPEIDIGTGGVSNVVEAAVDAVTWNAGIGAAIRLVRFVGLDLSLSGGVTKWKSHDDRIAGAQALIDGSVSEGNFMGRVGLSFGATR